MKHGWNVRESDQVGAMSTESCISNSFATNKYTRLRFGLVFRSSRQTSWLFAQRNHVTRVAAEIQPALNRNRRSPNLNVFADLVLPTDAAVFAVEAVHVPVG